MHPLPDIGHFAVFMLFLTIFKPLLNQPSIVKKYCQNCQRNNGAHRGFDPISVAPARGSTQQRATRIAKRATQNHKSAIMQWFSLEEICSI